MRVDNKVSVVRKHWKSMYAALRYLPIIRRDNEDMNERMMCTAHVVTKIVHTDNHEGSEASGSKINDFTTPLSRPITHSST